MAGNPKRTLASLEDIAAQADEVSGAIHEMLPSIYRDLTQGGRHSDVVGLAWHRAIKASVEANAAVSELIARIAARAKVPREVSANTLIAIDDEEYPLSEWARLLGQPLALVMHRITRRNWDAEEAIYGSPKEGELAEVEAHYGAGSVAMPMPRSVVVGGVEIDLESSEEEEGE
jgi:hypothetical protein